MLAPRPSLSLTNTRSDLRAHVGTALRDFVASTWVSGHVTELLRMPDLLHLPIVRAMGVTVVRFQIAASALLVVSCLAACSSSGAVSPSNQVTSSAPANASTSADSASSASTASSGAGSGLTSGSDPAASATGVTFDGAYSGTMKVMNCVGSGPTTTVSVTMVFAGVTSTGHTGNISSTELGWQGPDNADYDSGFLNSPLDADGKGFVLDGIKVKDEDGKTVTLHGTLRCP
jgi:hypothetical protein